MGHHGNRIFGERRSFVLYFARNGLAINRLGWFGVLAIVFGCEAPPVLLANAGLLFAPAAHAGAPRTDQFHHPADLVSASAKRTMSKSDSAIQFRRSIAKIYQSGASNPVANAIRYPHPLIGLRQKSGGQRVRRRYSTDCLAIYLLLSRSLSGDDRTSPTV